MAAKTQQINVRLESLPDLGIDLGDIFWDACQRFKQNMCAGVIIPPLDPQQQMALPRERQMQAGSVQEPIKVTPQTWRALPGDLGELANVFRRCRPGEGFGFAQTDIEMVTYHAARAAFTETLQERGITHLRVI